MVKGRVFLDSGNFLEEKQSLRVIYGLGNDGKSKFEERWWFGWFKGK
jgi:hypothetical protein